MDRSDPGTTLLLRLMSASSLRSRVLAGNIANQNVPGYKRRYVDFEDALRKELARPGTRVADVQPRIETDLESPTRADGNNVHLEGEVSAMRENRLLFEMYASMLAGRHMLLRAAIHGDR